MSPSSSSRRPVIKVVSKRFRRAWCKKHAWRAGPPTLRRLIIRTTFGFASRLRGLAGAEAMDGGLASDRGVTKFCTTKRFNVQLQGMHRNVLRSAQLHRCQLHCLRAIREKIHCGYFRQETRHARYGYNRHSVKKCVSIPHRCNESENVAM